MKLEVTPSLARVDEVLTVRVSGCQPSKTVHLIAQMGEGDWEWTSQSNFIADSEGTVDVSKAVSVSGSYEGQDPMGLIWSMELCERGKEKWRSGHFERVAGEVRVKRTFQAECAGKRSEPVISTAYYARAPVTYSAIREQGVVASMFHRPGVRRPGIIVLSGSGGGMDGSMAALLAAHGYTTIALAYFGIDGLPKELRQIPLEYFETAINWFRSHGDVLPESIGAAGSSRGGELALLLGSRFPEIRAVVSYVGSGLVLGAVTQTRSIVQLPAWMWRGEPIEPLSAEEMKPEFLESDGRHLWALERLKDKQAAERASIPVENIRGPVLLISGEEDALWPSTAFSEVAIERLKRSRFPFPYEHLVYHGAGHNISPPFHATTFNHVFHPVTKQLYPLGGNPRDNAHACADSWKRVLSLFRTHLRGN
jgi:dienelactone hydrolase